MTESAAPPIPAQPARVKPRKGSKLEALHAQYADAKAAADAATERLDAIKAGLKLALNQAHPDSPHVVLTGDAGPALEVVYNEGSWRLDTTRMKREDPETYVRFAKQGSPSWTLREVRGGGQ